MPLVDRRSSASHATPLHSAERSSRQIEAVDLSKSYGGENVVKEVSFTLREGEFLTLLGPSGSGKTTTLLMVAGFERPTRGDIRVGGRSVVSEPPQRRNLGVVFQSYALFPHLSVIENVAFPLRMRKADRRERLARAAEVLDNVGLKGLESRRPRELSGGQQQRVAVARALVFEPDALLLDEPLGALDKRLREQMQLEIKDLHRRIGISVLYVTHDQEEAMTMSDQVAVMRDGRIVQLASPMEVYHRPNTPFVAHFLGETNLLPCERRASRGEHIEVVYGDRSRGLVQRPPPGEPAEGESTSVSVRPERVRVLSERESCENEADAVVADRTFLGSSTRYLLRAFGQDVIVIALDSGGAPLLEPGATARIGWSATDAQLMSAES